MMIQDLIGVVIKNSKNLGIYRLPELLKFAAKNKVTGIAIAKAPDRELYFAFIDGEPEGAIYVDSKGTLYGDKAVMMITDRENFVLSEATDEIAHSIIIGCRIFEKSHLKKIVPSLVPEVGRKNVALGVLTVVVRRGNERQNGIRVSVRKDGKIDGSDVTTNDGTVSFKLLHGKYECILQNRDQTITTRRLTFDDSHTTATMDL
jgi:hypothetical protein